MKWAVLFQLLFFGLLFWRLSKAYTPSHLMEEALEVYWRTKGYPAVEVSALNNSEKIAYGVPLLPMYRFFGRIFNTLFFGTDVIWCKVGLIDPKGNESTKFVEVRFKHKKLVNCSVFDAYDI